MKARRPFLTLVKFELFRLWNSFGTIGHLMWALGFVWSVLPAVFLIGGRWAENVDLQAAFPVLIGLWSAGWLFGWLFLLGFHCAFALTREIRSSFPLMTMPDGNSDEFFGTRAVNLRLLFRAKTLALALVMVAPLLLNVAVFVGNQVFGLMGDTHDAIMFALWLLWVAGAAITLVQAYYGLISQLLVKRSRRLASYAVALLPVGSLVAIPLFAGSDTRLFQDAFIYFAEFWIPFVLALGLLAFVVQRFCEQRFAEQEVL